MPPRESSWAKAPSFADQPEVRARIRETTTEDRRAYLEGGLHPLKCERCGTCVLAKKNSPKHTTVQWKPNAVGSCPEFARQTHPGGNSAHLDTCPDLQASIDTAVHEGRIVIPDQD